ncbi:MAG: PaaI family thioesterase [Nitrospirota bacterium]
MKLEDDNYCFVCGKDNPIGLKLIFKIDRESRTIKTEFIPSKLYQGYKDIVHGGIISTILDEAMVKLAIGLGMNVVTVDMDMRFKKPLLVGEKITVSATIHKEVKRIIETKAQVVKDDGTIVAEGEARLMRVE